VGPLTPTQMVVASCAALAIAAVLGEMLCLALRDGRSRVARLPTVAAMAAGSLVTAAIVHAWYRQIWTWLQAPSRLGPLDLPLWWTQHPWLALGVAFVAWDAAGYAYHRVGHSTRLGWASHRVHHTGGRYDLSLAWRQSWFPLPALVVFPCVALTGVPLWGAAVSAAVSNLWQALLHTERAVRLPRCVDRIVMTPSTHRRHHALDGGAVNLGPVLTCWDRVGGTWDPTPVPPDADYGVRGEPDTGGVLRVESYGWRELVAHRPPSGQRARRVRRPAVLPQCDQLLDRDRA